MDSQHLKQLQLIFYVGIYLEQLQGASPKTLFKLIMRWSSRFLSCTGQSGLDVNLTETSRPYKFYSRQSNADSIILKYDSYPSTIGKSSEYLTTHKFNDIILMSTLTKIRNSSKRPIKI